MTPIVWTHPALDDLDAIQDFVAAESPKAAFTLIDLIINRTKALLMPHPEFGRTGRVRGTRELVLPDTPYIVVYRLRDRIEILAIVHGARNWPESFP